MMIDNFIITALIGGLGIATLAGILGSFMLWKNMAYFGDALSHSALLGITIGVLYNCNLNFSIMLTAATFAALFSYNKSRYSSDTILGILSYSALAMAIILSSYHKVKMDLISYLFGDILTITEKDLYCLVGAFVVIITWVYYNWSKLVLYSLSPELLKAEGVNTQLLKLGFALILALFVAISFKIVGVLLITALLIIPAAAALSISNSPLQMVKYSIIIGCLSVIMGMFSAFYFDIPTGPSIIISSLLLFLMMNCFSSLRRI